MAKTKKIKDSIPIKEDSGIIPKYIIPFYTKERWQNWIGMVKESDFKIDDQDKYAVFVNMTDDVILACLKIIAKYDKGLLKKDDANKYLSEIKEIVLKKIDPINDDIDIVLESTQLSMIGVFTSCERYVDKAFEITKSFDKLINSALQAEENNDMGKALDCVATIGANILSGESLDNNEIDKISSEGLVIEWLDGIDSLSVAMIGDTSYRDDEPDSGN